MKHSYNPEFLQKFHRQIRKTLQKKKQKRIGFQNSHKEENKKSFFKINVQDSHLHLVTHINRLYS